MIPKDYITAWREQAPWTNDAQVEQDLIISRTLVELFREPEISQSVLFRGGTALYKLYFTPAARYSEDIDLVQIHSESIGEMMDKMRSILDPWLGEPKRDFKEGRVNLIYRIDSEDAPPVKLRLKIEINTREHFVEGDRTTVPFTVDNTWFRGTAEISTFTLDELLGSKLRALYQRKKGRDLFDLWQALATGMGTPENIVKSFRKYASEGGRAVTRAQFEENLAIKRNSKEFQDDIGPLLHPRITWDFDKAMDVVLDQIIALVPGDPWKGKVNYAR